jgi:hypothetical protein
VAVGSRLVLRTLLRVGHVETLKKGATILNDSICFQIQKKTCHRYFDVKLNWSVVRKNWHFTVQEANELG